MPAARPDRARRPGRRPGPARGGQRPRDRRLPTRVAKASEVLRPRLTGRAAILVLVLAVLAVSYGSSMRAYFQQRAHITAMQEQIAEKRESIERLEKEKARWKDPAFVRAEARERFGYLMPGETSYVVLDESGRPLESESRLSDPSTVAQEPPAPVYGDLWESVKLAGDPPAPQSPTTQIGRTPKGKPDRLDSE